MRYANILMVFYFASSCLLADPNFIVVPVPFQDPQLAINAFWAANLNGPGPEARPYGQGYFNTSDFAFSFVGNTKNSFPWPIPSEQWCAKRTFVRYEADYLCSDTLQKVRNARLK